MSASSPVNKPDELRIDLDNVHVAKPEPKGHWPEIIAAMIILVSFLALSSLQVISRYVFDAPMVWTEELSANLLIWMTFFGATAIMRSDTHIRVEFVEELAGPRVAACLFAVFDVVIIIFLCGLVYGGWELMSQLEFERTPALRIPIAWIVAIVPISSFVMIGYAIANAVRRMRVLFGKQNNAH
ncbi:MAG: TRAP transporter small permease [Rhodospirillales bacterium]